MNKRAANKKAALELSITAIVVLIIAITILGLGIGFIKKQFGAGTELVGGELSNIKEKIKQDVISGGELIVFSVPDDVSIGKPKTTFFGVRNTGDNPDGDRVCFRVEVKCIQPFTFGAQCSKDTNGPIIVGGIDIEAGEPPKEKWFKDMLGQFDLKDYEGDVFPVSLLVRGVKPDSYQMEMNVYKDIGDKSCSEGGDFDPEDVYASKSFVLKVI